MLMTDIIVAIGFALVIEGLMLAAFPAGAKRMAISVRDTPEFPLRVAGIVAAAGALILLWALQGRI
jgi:uncharacterized protein YjeT (DUF2065 family)